MTDRRPSPTDFYSPTDLSALPLATPDSIPETPLLQGIYDTAMAAQDAEGAPARRQQAIDEAYAPIVEELTARGMKGRYRFRDPRAAWQLVYDEGAIWTDIARARAADPKAFADAGNNVDDFRRRATASVDAQMQARSASAQRTGTVPWAVGQLWSGASDPLNVALLPFGASGAKSVGEAILRDALLNAQIEAAQQPTIAIERAKRGEQLTAGEAIQNVAIAAGVGGAFGGAVHGGGWLATRTAESPLVRDTLARIGLGRMTETERAAATVIEREIEIEATSPFAAGGGTEAHVERLDRATAALSDPESVPSRTTRADPYAARQALKARIRAAESGGNDQAAAKGSTAFGRYQFTEGTWARLYKRRYGNTGETRAQILARRADPDVQERLVDDLIADNAAKLQSIGEAESATNLYLMHFAGQEGGARILRADPETPIASILGADAVRANPWLAGKTAGDVIGWAARKMGDDGAAPKLRRDLFADDEAFAAAQRAVDAEEAAYRSARAVDARAGDDGAPMVDAAPIEADEPATFDIMPGSKPVLSTTSRYLATARAAIERPGREAVAVLDHPDIGKVDIALNSPDSSRGAFSRQLAERPELVERLPDLLAAAHVTERNRNRLYLESDDGTAALTLQLDPATERWRVASLEPARAPKAGAAVDVPPEATLYWRTQVDGGADPLPAYVARSDSGEVLGVSSDRQAINRLLIDQPGKWRVDRLEAPTVESFTPTVRPSLEGFADPVGGNAIARQVATLEHDLRLRLADEPNATVRLDEADVPIVNVLAEFDADSAAIEAARRCLI